MNLFVTNNIQQNYQVITLSFHHHSDIYSTLRDFHGEGGSTFFLKFQVGPHQRSSSWWVTDCEWCLALAHLFNMAADLQTVLEYS